MTKTASFPALCARRDLGWLSALHVPAVDPRM